MISKILDFLNSTGLKVFDTTNDVSVDCFLCDDKRHRLGVNKENGKWSCFNCRSGGKELKSLVWAYKNKNKVKNNVTIEVTTKERNCTIKKDFHVQFHKDLHKKKDGKFKHGMARYLLKERKISKEAINYFELGTRRKFKSRKGPYDAGEHLVIPYIKDGECVNIKYRSIEPDTPKERKWRREEGGVSTLYNDTVLDNFDYNEFIIVESEIDAMSLWCLGFKNVIGLTTGAGGFKNKPEWYDRLERVEKFYLMLDNDKAGQEGAKELAKFLGFGRCFNVKLPDDVKDPNDMLVGGKYSKDDITDMLSKGKQYDLENVDSLSTLVKRLHHRLFVDKNAEVQSKYDTPWAQVNEIIGPLRKGFLFILAGKAKAGKTSVALDMMTYWGKKNINTAIYSCEMRNERIGDKLVMSEPHSCIDIEDLEEIELHRAMLRLPLNRIHSFEPKHEDDIKIDGVVSNVENIVRRHCIEIMVIDNLHYLCRGENENALISEATQKLKLMAERLDILLIVITHPRKTNTNKQLEVEDLKGSSTIMQDADVIWLQHRPFEGGEMTDEEVMKGFSKSDALTFKTDIKVKGRWTKGGNTFLFFSGAMSKFLNKGEGYKACREEFGTGGNSSNKSNRKPRKGL